MRWDTASKSYVRPSGDEQGSFGAPFYDSVDLEWDKKYVEKLPQDVQQAIVNNKFRFGLDTSGEEDGADLRMPLPGNPGYGEPFYSETYLQWLHPGHSTTIEVPYKTAEGGLSTHMIDIPDALRSNGFPMCPNYWDAHGGDNPGPLNLATDNSIEQDSELYKFPNKVVGSPLVGASSGSPKQAGLPHILVLVCLIRPDV